MKTLYLLPKCFKSVTFKYCYYCFSKPNAKSGRTNQEPDQATASSSTSSNSSSTTNTSQATNSEGEDFVYVEKVKKHFLMPILNHYLRFYTEKIQRLMITSYLQYFYVFTNLILQLLTNNKHCIRNQLYHTKMKYTITSFGYLLLLKFSCYMQNCFVS